MGSRIGLFGGTFDPVHSGHVALVNSFLKSGLIDELWILPSPDPPHKTDKNITPFEHRKKMLDLLFENADQVLINDIEQKLPLPSYTIQTIQYLKQKYPEHQFYLCIGGDSIANFDSWYKADRIAEECDILVAERPDSGTDTTDNRFLQRATFVEHTPVKVSASSLRTRLAENSDKPTDDIPSEVMAYIREQGLYSD